MMPLCSTIGCDAAPAFKVYWPGRPRQHFCAACTARAECIAEAAGFLLVTEPLDPTPTGGAVCE